MQTIILDTNFLVYLLEFKIDLFAELDRITEAGYNVKILDKTLEELEYLAKTNMYAEIALRTQNKFKTIPTKPGEKVDDILANITDKDTIIGTQDRELKKRLQTPILVIRQKKYLTIQW